MHITSHDTGMTGSTKIKWNVWISRHENSTHSQFYCQQSYRIMINPYNLKIKSVNIIWTLFFLMIISIFYYICSKIVGFCVIPLDKD